MKKKTWMKCIASCLTFVLLVTMVPVQAAANTEKEGGTGTPGTASGGAASIATRLQLQQQVRRRLQQQVRRRLQQPQ